MTDALGELIERARELPFVALVRWLEHLLPDAAEVGRSGPFRAEPVRFGCAPELTFADAELAHATLAQGPGPTHARLTLAFGGLVGAGSPLPTAMLDELASDDDDTAAERAFLDLFHHRLAGLLYRGSLKFDLARSQHARRPAPALDWVLGLSGLPPAHAARVSGLPRRVLLRLAPLLVVYPPNAQRLVVALRAVLAETIGEAAVRVHELRGGSVEIEPRFRARLGRDLRLGRSSTLGARAPFPAAALVISLGPLTPAVARRLAPGGDQTWLLEATVALFCPETVDVELQLELTRSLPTRLGAVGTQLGRGAWLGTRSAPRPLRWRLHRSSTVNA
jgi:type VI secretion system ImpH/TssG family protein